MTTQQNPAASEPLVAEQWRPIETAPQHGTILLWWKNAGAVTGGFAIDEGWTPKSKMPREGWRGDGDEGIPRNQEDCTHWQLLRAPAGCKWPRFSDGHSTQEWFEEHYATPVHQAAEPVPNEIPYDLAVKLTTYLGFMPPGLVVAASPAPMSQAAVEASRDAVFRSRVADLLHLLSFATISTPTPTDAHQAHFIAESLRTELADARVTSQAVPVALIPGVLQSRAAPAFAASPAAPEPVLASEDTARLDWLDTHPTMIKFSYELGAWITPGGFEESTLRQAIDIFREDLARAPAPAAGESVKEQ